MATALTESTRSTAPAASRVRVKQTGPEKRQRPAVARDDRTSQPLGLHVIREGLFRGLMKRERRRADRANQAILLVLVSSDNAAAAASSTWTEVMEALAETKRETDFLGWFENDRTVGLILTEIDALSPDFAREYTTRLRRAFSKRISLDAIERLTVRFHAYPDAAPSHEAVAHPVFPLPAVDLTPSRTATLYNGLKRAIDIVGSASLLLALAPLLLLTAALVKLASPGPVFFRQVRVGQMKSLFTMLKFRTMHVNADSAVHQKFVSDFIKSKSRESAATGEAPFKIVNDARVTRIGAILRKTSIDELPQLWNVLRGDMSLVGPRPPLPYELEQYERWHCRRVMDAKPGLTGLWQVAGRSRTTFDEMVRLDLRYAKNRSLSTDVKILLATPAAVIAGKGAC